MAKFQWKCIQLVGLLLSLFMFYVGAQLFHTATIPSVAAQAQRVRFANIGDFGIRGPGEQAVATLVKQWQPDFIVTNGDNNYQRGTAAEMDDNVGTYYHDYIYPYIGSYGAGATENRFWPALGDHDWYSLTCTNGSCTGPHFDYFTLPGNERYYDLAKGPVHLFILDTNPNEPDGFLSTSPQGEWLRQQLAAAPEPWKIVISHHPPYSSGSVHGSINSAQWPYKAWGANAVISGNEHTYERLMVDGLPYFVNGLGGNTPYTFTMPVLPQSQVQYNGGNGALFIEATDEAITFQFINTAGEIIDTFTLDHPTLAPNTPTPTPPLSGLQYQYYEGNDATLQDLATLKPLKTGVVNNLNLSPNHRGANFAFRYSGCISVATTGIYTFSATTDDRTRLNIDGIRVFDSPAQPFTQTASGGIQLAAGVHALDVNYTCMGDATPEPGSGDTTPILTMSTQGANLAKQDIPDNTLTQNNCRIPPGRQYRYVRFVAKSEVHAGSWIALAELDLFDGNWNYIPKKGWHTTYADSEEFANGEGYAPYIIDDDPYTAWETEHFTQTTSFPHEVRIDLGASYTLSTFRYLPRQDEEVGRIADYEFYVSQNGVQWVQVAQGRFPNTADVQEVDFSKQLAEATRATLFMPLIHAAKR